MWAWMLEQREKHNSRQSDESSNEKPGYSLSLPKVLGSPGAYAGCWDFEAGHKMSAVNAGQCQMREWEVQSEGGEK